VITAEATVTGTRADKPVTSLATRITKQDGVTVLDGSAVVWRTHRRGLGLREAPGKAAEANFLASTTQHTTPETGTTMEDP
jgi:hypothetical protein